MCNEFAQERAWRAYCEEMQRIALDIRDPTSGDFLPAGSIRPSLQASAIEAIGDNASRLTTLLWGWPLQKGGIMINARNDNPRHRSAKRVILPADSFFEYQPGKAPKPKFSITPAFNEPMALAGLVRNEAFVLVTTDAGPDLAAIHDRPPVVLPLSSWRRWLTDDDWPADLTEPAPAGTLATLQVR